MVSSIYFAILAPVLSIDAASSAYLLAAFECRLMADCVAKLA